MELSLKEPKIYVQKYVENADGKWIWETIKEVDNIDEAQELISKHREEEPHVAVRRTNNKDLKQYQCFNCGKDLFYSWTWDFANNKPALKTQSGYTHRCFAGSSHVNERPHKCKYCKADDLLWLRVNGKWQLLESYGLPHFCDGKYKYLAEKREALKRRYAAEKKRVLSKPVDSQCKNCHGKGFKIYNTTGNVGMKTRKCRSCKGIGIYSTQRVKEHLATLRRRYWPFAPWMLNKRKKK